MKEIQIAKESRVCFVHLSDFFFFFLTGGLLFRLGSRAMNALFSSSWLILSPFLSNKFFCFFFFWFSPSMSMTVARTCSLKLTQDPSKLVLSRASESCRQTPGFYFLRIHAPWYFNSGHMYFPSDLQFKFSLDQLMARITLSIV